MKSIPINKDLKIESKDFKDNKTLAYCEVGDTIRFKFNNIFVIGESTWIIKIINKTKGLSIHMNISDFKVFTEDYTLEVVIIKD